MVVTSSAPIGGLTAISQRRAGLAGPPGIKGLMSNLRIFAIAVFASLGGLVYGCTCPVPTIFTCVLFCSEVRKQEACY